MALGRPAVQDAGARRRSDRRRQGAGEWRPGKAREIAQGGRPHPRTPRPLRVPAHRRGALRASGARGGSGAPLRGGSGWEARPRGARRPAQAAARARLSRQGPPHEEAAPRHGALEGGAVGRLIYAAAGVRSLTIGFTGVAFGLFLAALGLTATQLGAVVALGLAGNAAGTALVAAYGDRLGRRRALVLASALSAGGLAVVAVATRPAVLAVAALLGMVNGMGRDRGPAQTIDQSFLAGLVAARGRTAAFTRYTFVQDVSGALGSLAAAVPAVLATRVGLAAVPAYRWTFFGAALLSLVPIALYARVTEPAAAAARTAAERRTRLGPGSRRRVAGLVGLLALDSLGGGFLAGSILSYWFFRRYGLGGEALGPVFFAARGLNAVSYFAAEALARRVGLIP